MYLFCGYTGSRKRSIPNFDNKCRDWIIRYVGTPDKSKILPFMASYGLGSVVPAPKNRQLMCRLGFDGSVEGHEKL